MKSIYSKGYKKLLEELIKARKKSGFTQTALAKILKKPQSFVSKFENGERRLDIAEFVFIANAMNLNYKKIIDLAFREMEK